MTTITDNINAFVKYKHGLGLQYETGERHIRKFETFMLENYPGRNIPDKECLDRFLQNYEGQSGGLYNVLAVVREFSRYLHMIGHAEAYVVPSKQMPKLDPEPPYFFEPGEITGFFQAADMIYANCPKKADKSLVYPAMFRLIHCCGLRPSEGRTLLVENTHWDDCYFDVMQSKGPKSRRIYVNDEVAEYMKRYDMLISEIHGDRIYFFPNEAKTAYTRKQLDDTFKAIWKSAYPGFTGSRHPRPYDFRHYFAWTTINGWVREGKDVNVMLPYLSRYMGHNCIKHTLYYFRFVPDFYGDFEKITSELNDRVPEVEYETE